MILKLEYSEIDLIFPSKSEIINYENLKSISDASARILYREGEEDYDKEGFHESKLNKGDEIAFICAENWHKEPVLMVVCQEITATKDMTVYTDGDESDEVRSIFVPTRPGYEICHAGEYCFLSKYDKSIINKALNKNYKHIFYTSN